MITNILLGLILIALIGIGYLVYRHIEIQREHTELLGKNRVLLNGIFGLLRIERGEKLDYMIINLHAIWEKMARSKNQYPIMVPDKGGFKREVVNGDY